MYGQKNYNEYLGFGKLRIAQAGCFLVAQANLLKFRFGNDVTPLTLNAAYKVRGYLPDPTDRNIKQWLSWWSPASFDNGVQVTRTGKGNPPSDNCIVKFVYKGGLTHFCLVDSHAKGTIVDSFDGAVKSWNVYGGPKEWAEYKDNTPHVVAQVIKPVPTSPNYNGDTITILPGWGLSHAAKAAGYPDWDGAGRWAAIAALNGTTNWQTFNKSLYPGQVIKVGKYTAPAAPAPAQASDVVNITVKPGWGITHVLKAAGYPKESYEREGEWDRVAALNGSATRLRLHPGQVVKVNRTPLPLPTATPAPAAAAPTVAPAATAAETVEVKVVKTDPNAWQQTFKPEDKIYIASKSSVVHDVTGLQKDLQLYKNQKVNSGGTFSKDGVNYVRTKKHIELGYWYGVPKEDLDAGQDSANYVGPLINDPDEEDLFNLDMAMEAREVMRNLSSKERFVALIARIEGAFISVFGIFKRKKK